LFLPYEVLLVLLVLQDRKEPVVRMERLAHKVLLGQRGPQVLRELQAQVEPMAKMVKMVPVRIK
jgi:hypothetical protein